MRKKDKQIDETGQLAERQKQINARLKALGLNPQNHVEMTPEDFKPTVFIPTGIVEIDSVIGCDGFPQGTLIELCGESQSGKTFAALTFIASACSRGLRSAFMNVENTFYDERAKAIGVPVGDYNKFELYNDLGTAETWATLITEMIKSKEYGVIVVDSVSALVPEADYTRAFDKDPKIGAHAMFMNRFMRRILPLCKASGTIVILINQFRMGAADGARSSMDMVKKATGGAAMDFFTHIRLWINKLGFVDGIIKNADGDIIGGKSQVVVMKNRFGPPGGKTIFSIMFTDAERDHVIELLYRGTMKGPDPQNKYITYVRKEYKYVDLTTGEIYCKSKSPYEFVEMLKEAPAPEKLTRGDESKNGFEWLCGRLKATPADIEAIEKKLERVRNAEGLEMVYGDDEGANELIRDEEE